MGRTSREHEEGGIYHAISRGNRRQPIFLDQLDYQYFLMMLKVVKKRYKFKLLAYCLMPNHWHMLMKAAAQPISLALRDLLGRYANYFNRKYAQYGHVFQGRYRSFTVKDDSYILGAARYIDMNPVDAKLVDRAEDWRWGGQAEVKGQIPLKLLDREIPLAILSENAKRAEAIYADFLRTKAPKRGRPKKQKSEIRLPPEVLLRNRTKIVAEVARGFGFSYGV